MKKLLSFLILLLSFGFSNSFGQINDDFTGLTVAGDLNGQASWSRTSGSATQLTVANASPLSGSFGYNSAGGNGGAGGNYVQVAAPIGTTTRYTKAYNGFVMANAGEGAYYSFLINVSAATSGGDFFFVLNSSTNYVARLFAKTSGTGYILGASKNSTTGTYNASPNVLTFGTTYLVVVRYLVVTGTSNDQVHVWINPTLTATEPATGTAEVAITAGSDPSTGTYSNFMYTNISTSNPTFKFDGLKVAGGTSSSAAWTSLGAYIACTNPVFSQQPTDNQTECAGGTLTLGTVAASQSPTYQWYSVGTKTNTGGTTVGAGNGGNTATYTPPSGTAGTFYYYCIATSGSCTTTSSAVQITINGLPNISSQSTGTATYGQGFGSASPLTVTAAGAGLTYQWFSSTDNVTNTAGDDIALGTSSSQAPSTAVIGTLYYYCMVSGTCTPTVTSAISGAINIVAACTAPAFSVQPTNGQSECIGGALTLGTVVADQSPTYQWYSNTSLLNTGGTSVGSGNGGSTATYTPPSGVAGTFFYYCVATSGACPTPSNAVQITVNNNTISGQSTAGATYSLNAVATALTVTATGPGLSYVWKSSTDAATNTTGDDITVGTNSNSFTPPTSTLGTLYYYCTVTGTCATVTSAVSGAIVIVQYAVGDFGSLGTGNWGTTNANWRTWNGSAFANTPASAPTATDNVFILAGHTVTVEASAKNCKNLTVEGTLKSSTLVNTVNYVRINGTPGVVTVNGAGFIGDVANLTGDNSNGIGLDLFGTNITINGTATNNIYVSRIKTNTNGTTLTIDNNVTLNYHGGTNQGGHTTSLMPNAAAVDNTTVVINSGKTLTLAPWSCIGTTSSSNNVTGGNFTLTVNGTLTLQDAPAPNVQVVPTANSFIYGGVAAGKVFTMTVGAGGVVNTPQIYPNGTVSGGAVGTGSDAVITVNGTLNVSKTADLRKPSQTVGGTGAFSIANGGTLRIGNANGITSSGNSGSVQTGTRTFNTGANYSYESSVAQTTGNGLTSANDVTFSNSAGVSLSGNVTVNGTLDLTNTVLTTGANTATANAAVNRTTGWVNGNLQRAIAAGANTAAFPIGDATAYAPLSINSGAANSGGNLTASTTKPGVAPAAGIAPTGSGIDQVKYIDRSWTVSSTIGTPDYDATFTYIDPADIAGGANTSALIIAKNSAGTWSNPGVASSLSPSVSTVTGQASFSTFYLGEAAITCVNVGLSSASASATPICSNATTTLTYSGLTGTNATVTWYDGPGGTGGTHSTGTPSSAVGPGTYYARATGDCGSAVEIQVIVSSKVDAGLTSATATATPICSAATTTLTYSGLTGTNATVTWYDGAGGTGGTHGTGTPSSAVGPGTYYARATGDCGSPVEIQVIVASKADAGLASATATATPICSAATTTLTYSGLTGTNATVTWYDGAGGTGGTHGTGTPSSAVGPGTYYAYATGDCGSPVEIQVIVGSKVNVSITSATASPAGPLCSGQTTTLSANGVAGTNAVVTWYTGPNGTGVNLGTGTSLPGQGANTYYARVTGDCGAAQEQSVTVGSTGNTFTGTGNWTDNARWSCGAPPSSGDAVTIGAGANAVLNTNFIVSGSLTMTATSTLTVNPTRTLSVDVAATANFNGQSVTFQSDATGTASLGQVNGTLSGATNVTVERYVPNNGFRSWRLLSVPTFGNGQTIKQAWQENQTAVGTNIGNNNPGFGTQITGPGYNVAAQQALGFDNAGVTSSLLAWNGTGWTGQTTTLQPIAGQKAWFLFVRGERNKGVTGLNGDASATTLRTNGTVYTGDQVNTIGANATALIGNVYPSAIDFTGLTRTAGVANAFYIWDSKKLNGTSLGAYQTFSATNGYLCLLSGGSYTVGQPNTSIESGQGFLVKGTTGGTLTLKESAKISGTNGNLGLRPSTQRSKIDSRLYNANNEMLDANVVVFDAAYSKSVDTDDAIKFGNPGTNFAVETASTILAVEGTQPPADKDAVQFRMWSMQPQNYKLELTATNMVTEGLTATLEDAYLKTSTPIDLSATTSVNFTVDANAGSSDANRFRVVFSKAKPAVTDTKQGYTIAPNPVENGIVNLQFHNQPAGKYGIRIMSTGGQAQKAVTITHAGGSSTQQLALPSTLASGTYQLEIITPNKTRILKTVLVNRK